ncbi:DUF167 domain-containing protein [Chloroflexota bacterium]
MVIAVRVHPSAKKSKLVGFNDGVWQVKVSAPPVKGKANAELIALLSEVLSVSKSHLSIVKGHTSRSKVIAIGGLSQEEITKRLSSSCEASSR